MVFSKAFLATTEKKFDEDLTFSIENKCIYIFITIIIIIYIYLLFVVVCFSSSCFVFYLVNCACMLSWMMGCKLYANEVRPRLTFKLPSMFHEEKLF